MTNATNSLQCAIDYLGAIEIEPGVYAWYGPTERRWLVVSRDDLMRFLPARGSRLTDAVGEHFNSYTSWLWNLGDKRAVRMPMWWTPENRHAYRDQRDGTIVRESALPTPPPLGPQWKRITADIQTGDEVLA